MTLLFKIHYFLWYGAHTAIFGYESVYAQQYTNASMVQYGTLKMILPFIAVVVTPLVCSRADRKRAHRLYFTLSLVLATITLVAYTFLPLTMHASSLQSQNFTLVTNDSSTVDTRIQQYEWFGASYSRGQINLSKEQPAVVAAPNKQLEKPQQHLWSGPWVFFCANTLLFELALAVATCLSDSFAVLQAEETGTSFGQIILWGTFGWAASALLLGYINQIDTLPRLLPGLLLSAACLVADLLLVVLWPRPNDFKLDRIPSNAARSLTGSCPPGHHEPSDYQPANEVNLINLGADTTSANVETTNDRASKWHQRRVRSPLELLAESPEPSGQSDDPAKSSVNKSNACTSNSDGTTKTERPISESVNTKRLCNDKENLVAIGEETTSLCVQMRLFLLILARRKVLIRFLALFCVSGFFMSMHWNYFFLYLEQIFAADFTLLSALSMVGQSLLGELPFFILSQLVIDKLGRSHTLSLSLVSMGVRFLIYRYLLVQASKWCIFLADCLQGPNYGLFYVVMTEVGLEYSYCDAHTISQLARAGLVNEANKRQVDAVRLALRSTVQSVAFACYEGLGVGLGSLAGGLLLAHYDFDLLWLSMALAAIAIGLLNVLVELACREQADELPD